MLKVQKTVEIPQIEYIEPCLHKWTGEIFLPLIT